MSKYLGTSTLLLCILGISSASADAGFYIGLEGGQGSTELGREDDHLVLSNGVLLGTSSDRRDSVVGLYGGYTFAKHFSIELGYKDLGETSFTTVRDIQLGLPFPVPFPFPFPVSSGWSSGVPVVSFNPNPGNFPPVFGGVYAASAVLFREQQTTTFDTDALALSLLGRYEIGGSFALFGRAGLAVHRIETSVQVWADGLPMIVVGRAHDASAGAVALALGGEWSFHPDWALKLQAQRHFMLEEEDINLVERGDVTSVTAAIEYRF